MNNKLQNMLLGVLIVTGIVLCAMLFASESKSGDKESTARRTTASNGSTAPIINAPTTAVDIQTKLAVITAVNSDKKTLSVRTFDEDENYSFYIEQPVYIYTEYGNAMTLSQLYMGDVVDITYDALSNKVQEIRLTSDVICHRAVSEVSVNTAYRTLTIYGKNYGYSRNVVVVSGLQLITPEQLGKDDVINVYEKDGKVVSVVVTRGHGYISLTGVDLFLGGYVDIGGENIKTVEKNMMITVTEGEYKVALSKDGYYGAKTVKVNRDAVTVVDFSEYVADAVQNGNVFFDIDAEGAKLYLNGEETDYSEGILTIPVGTYSVRVSAQGYDNYVDKIEVVADYQKINIKMTPSETETQESTTAAETTAGSSNQGNGSSTGVTTQYETETTTKVSTTNRVYIDGPTGAIIYFDDSYLGVAPLDFAMVTGQHTFIVLSGSTVKSYTVNLVEGADDVRYDFSEK